MPAKEKYPDVDKPELIGIYGAKVFSGGGLVWDQVLEYRVWCSPHQGAEDLENGDDYYYVFVDYESAAAFSQKEPGAEKPVALVLQKEYIDEPEPGRYIHVKEPRITEWAVEFLLRPRRTEKTIPEFLSDDAPPNRLEILRGQKDRNNNH